MLPFLFRLIGTEIAARIMQIGAARHRIAAESGNREFPFRPNGVRMPKTGWPGFGPNPEHLMEMGIGETQFR